MKMASFLFWLHDVDVCDFFFICKPRRRRRLLPTLQDILKGLLTWEIWCACRNQGESTAVQSGFLWHQFLFSRRKLHRRVYTLRKSKALATLWPQKVGAPLEEKWVDCWENIGKAWSLRGRCMWDPCVIWPKSKFTIEQTPVCFDVPTSSLCQCIAMWKAARISAREVRHWQWKSDTRSQLSKELCHHYDGSEFPEQEDRRVPQKLQRGGERKTFWRKNPRPLDEGSAKTLIIQAFLYFLKLFWGAKGPKNQLQAGPWIKESEKPEGFSKARKHSWRKKCDDPEKEASWSELLGQV